MLRVGTAQLPAEGARCPLTLTVDDNDVRVGELHLNGMMPSGVGCSMVS
jgi:hypothetical protein